MQRPADGHRQAAPEPGRPGQLGQYRQGAAAAGAEGGTHRQPADQGGARHQAPGAARHRQDADSQEASLGHRPRVPEMRGGAAGPLLVINRDDDWVNIQNKPLLLYKIHSPSDFYNYAFIIKTNVLYVVIHCYA